MGFIVFQHHTHVFLTQGNAPHTALLRTGAKRCLLWARASAILSPGETRLTRRYYELERKGVCSRHARVPFFPPRETRLTRRYYKLEREGVWSRHARVPVTSQGVAGVADTEIARRRPASFRQ